MSTLIKAPADVLDYRWDWSKLVSGADRITAHTVSAEGVSLGATSHDDTSVTAWVSGGVAGERARLTARITSLQGRTHDRTIALSIEQR